ncbi:MAG: glycosyltransferase family 2 protein [Phycisphaerae bacterium]|nr:glycosyltransferase family 2 protein [Phycisphaerae bacterium]
MKTYPCVTVLMATYNGAHYIEEQLESILHQTYSPITLIISDDASEDKTLEIIQRYGQKDERISISHNEVRRGYVKNFENLLSENSGKYFAFADQDDIWELDKIAILMSAMLVEEQKLPKTAVLVHSDSRMINSNGKIILPSYAAFRGYKFKDQKDVATMISRCGVMGNTILFNDELKKRVLPFHPDVVHHDYWIAVINELFGTRVTLSQQLVSYRIHSKNTSKKIKLFEKEKFEYRVKGESTIRLPYYDNNRYEILKGVLSSYPLEKSDKKKLVIFLQYLRARGGWIKLYPKMVKEGFFKNSIHSHTKLIGKFLFASAQKSNSKLLKRV